MRMLRRDPRWAQPMAHERAECPGVSLLSRLNRDQPEIDLLRVDGLIEGNGARPDDVVPVIASLFDFEIHKSRLYRDGTGGSVLDRDAHARHRGVQDVADLRPRADLEKARQPLAQ